MNIKILGTGCSRCANLEKKVKETVADNNVEAVVEKVTDLQEIMKYGILMTPGLVINEKVVHYGSVPKEGEILKWIREAE